MVVVVRRFFKLHRKDSVSAYSSCQLLLSVSVVDFVDKALGDVPCSLLIVQCPSCKAMESTWDLSASWVSVYRQASRSTRQLSTYLISMFSSRTRSTYRFSRLSKVPNSSSGAWLGSDSGAFSPDDVGFLASPRSRRLTNVYYRLSQAD